MKTSQHLYREAYKFSEKYGYSLDRSLSVFSSLIIYLPDTTGIFRGLNSHYNKDQGEDLLALFDRASLYEAASIDLLDSETKKFRDDFDRHIADSEDIVMVDDWSSVSFAIDDGKIVINDETSEETADRRSRSSKGILSGISKTVVKTVVAVAGVAAIASMAVVAWPALAGVGVAGLMASGTFWTVATAGGFTAALLSKNMSVGDFSAKVLGAVVIAGGIAFAPGIAGVFTSTFGVSTGVSYLMTAAITGYAGYIVSDIAGSPVLPGFKEVETSTKEVATAAKEVVKTASDVVVATAKATSSVVSYTKYISWLIVGGVAYLVIS